MDKKRIRKKYRFINLLWLGIPFKWKEHSAKILDMKDDLIGYYRGHYESADGTINFLAYKNATLGIFEELFVIKILFGAYVEK